VQLQALKYAVPTALEDLGDFPDGQEPREFRQALEELVTSKIFP
jgi:hypothetical protein